MIIQTAPSGKPRLAVMMHEHTALAGQFARAFGNDRFEAVCPMSSCFTWSHTTTRDGPSSTAIP